MNLGIRSKESTTTLKIGLYVKREADGSRRRKVLSSFMILKLLRASSCCPFVFEATSPAVRVTRVHQRVPHWPEPRALWNKKGTRSRVQWYTSRRKRACRRRRHELRSGGSAADR